MQISTSPSETTKTLLLSSLDLNIITTVPTNVRNSPVAFNAAAREIIVLSNFHKCKFELKKSAKHEPVDKSKAKISRRKSRLDNCWGEKVEKFATTKSKRVLKKNNSKMCLRRMYPHRPARNTSNQNNFTKTISATRKS